MESLLTLVVNYGFPAVVAMYLLYRQEKQLDELNNLIKGKDGILDKIEEVLKSVYKNREK